MCVLYSCLISFPSQVFGAVQFLSSYGKSVCVGGYQWCALGPSPFPVPAPCVHFTAVTCEHLWSRQQRSFGNCEVLSLQHQAGPWQPASAEGVAGAL